MDLISSETAPTIDALGIRFTLADRDGDYACHVLRGAIDLLGDTAAGGDADMLHRFAAYRGKFERLGAEMRASGHVNPWIKPESVAAWFVDLADRAAQGPTLPCRPRFRRSWRVVAGNLRLLVEADVIWWARHSPIGSAMIFYRYFAVQDREALIDALASADPFALSPAEIVDRVLGLGHGPDVTKHVDEMWPTIGRVFEIRRDRQDFRVAISRDAEEISVQEMRADAYLPIE